MAVAGDDHGGGVSPARTRVIYIMGAGRSGSTILGVALGNSPEVFYAGELDAWLRRRAVPNFGGDERERFWADVRAEVPDPDGLFGDTAWQTFEHSAGALRAAGRDGPLRRRYRRVQRDLYRAIAERSGCDWVVDSAHYPLRARQLRTIPELDVHLLLLVRDPRSVVASFATRGVDQPTKSPPASNAYLWLTHLFSLYVYATHRADRRQFVRYEDFAVDPITVATRILSRVGASAPVDGAGDEVGTGSAFQGNRLLATPTVALRPAARARPPRGDVLTTLVHAPWLAAFGWLGRRSDR